MVVVETVTGRRKDEDHTSTTSMTYSDPHLRSPRTLPMDNATDMPQAPHGHKWQLTFFLPWHLRWRSWTFPRAAQFLTETRVLIVTSAYHYIKLSCCRWSEGQKVTGCLRYAKPKRVAFGPWGASLINNHSGLFWTKRLQPQIRAPLAKHLTNVQPRKRNLHV